MQIIWRVFGQEPDLASWESRPLSPTVEDGPRPGDNRDEYLRVVGKEGPGDPEPDGVYRALARAVCGYRVFPSWLVEGVLRRDPVEVGDTYGICYHFLPGIDLLFAGRVTHTLDERRGDTWQAGFTFLTVAGHAELGEETFWVEKDVGSGEVRFGIRSWSRPGTWLTRLGSPYLRWVQVRACHRALDNMEALGRQVQQAREAPPAEPVSGSAA